MSTEITFQDITGEPVSGRFAAATSAPAIGMKRPQIWDAAKRRQVTVMFSDLVRSFKRGIPMA